MWWLLLLILLAGCVGPAPSPPQEAGEGEGVTVVVEPVAGESGEVQNQTTPSSEGGITVAVEPVEGGGITVVVESAGEASNSANASEAPSPERRIWHYQLQDLSKDALKALDVPILVVEPDELSCSDVEELRQDKVVLAYLSIGEAEDYRDYWEEGWRPGNPSFIVGENPEWEGNYIVKFWDPRWKAIVFERARELAECYDGLYLDRVDVYREFNNPEEMVAFVGEVAEEARSVKGNLLIVPQNAVELYAYPSYREVVDGFGIEDTWYDGDERQEGEHTREVLRWARAALKDGKLILAVDYPVRLAPICNFYKKCWEEGFYCTVEDRELRNDRPTLCPLNT